MYFARKAWVTALISYGNTASTLTILLIHVECQGCFSLVYWLFVIKFVYILSNLTKILQLNFSFLCTAGVDLSPPGGRIMQMKGAKGYWRVSKDDKEYQMVISTLQCILQSRVPGFKESKRMHTRCCLSLSTVKRHWTVTGKNNGTSGSIYTCPLDMQF